MKKNEYELTIHGITIKVIHKNNKNMYLRVKEPEGQVVITAPLRMSRERIVQFVEERQEWIREAILRVQKSAAHKEETPVEAPFMERENRYRLKKQIEELIEKWEPQMGVKSEGFTIRKMKTRWGSCNVQTHHLNFNYALAKVSEECVEYVVVHELTHLLEPSHNARFWGLMEYYLPGAKKLRKELNGEL